MGGRSRSEPGDLDEREGGLDSIGLNAADTFEYVFDLDNEWRHECTILRDDVDPRGQFGETPNDIIPVWGWGSIPDQHGRTGPESEPDEESEDDR